LTPTVSRGSERPRARGGDSRRPHTAGGHSWSWHARSVWLATASAHQQRRSHAQNTASTATRSSAGIPSTNTPASLRDGSRQAL